MEESTVRSNQFIPLVFRGYMDRLVLYASKHISYVNVYGRYEVTILGAFMADPNRSIVTVTVKTSLFSFNLLHSGKSEICLLAIKKVFPVIFFTPVYYLGNECFRYSS